MASASAVAAGISDRLADLALIGGDMGDLYDECCRQVRAAGIPVIRGQVSFRILHPLYNASSLTWDGDHVAVDTHPPETDHGDDWQQSPFFHMIHARTPVLRRRLHGRKACLDFPLLARLKARGGTDYIAFLTSFQADWSEGTVASWLCDRPEGFTDGEIVDLRHITRFLSIALKTRIAHKICENIATAYLGREAGREVLQGSIRRGQGERLTAALWYSDVRGSTHMAETLSPEAFLAWLNRYFDRSAAVVLDHGGEIIGYVGDGVLAFFRDPSEAAACERALAAAQAAHAIVDDAGITFSTALHFGSFVFGNIGTADRLQFTAIGAAINELARVQEMTKTLNEPILATGAVAERGPEGWRELGAFRLRGVATPMSLLAPSCPVNAKAFRPPVVAL